MYWEGGPKQHYITMINKARIHKCITWSLIIGGADPPVGSCTVFSGCLIHGSMQYFLQREVILLISYIGSSNFFAKNGGGVLQGQMAMRTSVRTQIDSLVIHLAVVTLHSHSLLEM